MPRFFRVSGFGLAWVALVLLAGCRSARCPAPEEPASPPVRNVVIMIGDGMGVGQVTLGRICGPGADGSLRIDTMPCTGLVKTHSADRLVTDSAAAATAMSTGHKTDNHVIGQTPDGKNLHHLLDSARAMGKSTGLVTTTTITHATPAGFSCHIDARAKQEELAPQLIALGVNVLFGGGRKYFPKELRAHAEDVGYTVVENLSSKEIPAGDHVLGLFAREHMAYEVDRSRTDQPSILDMTRIALQLLSRNSRGFFLMVEGGKIDIAGHQHDAATMQREMRAFDEAIGAVLDFAAKDGNTLVLVTADHTTGGMGITELVKPEMLNACRASCERMTDDSGLDRHKLRKIVRENAGIELASDQLDRIVDASGEDGPAIALGDVLSAAGGINYYTKELQDRLQNTHGHDGTMVAVYAFGPGAPDFVGTQDNTDIAKKVARRMGALDFFR